MRLGGVLGIALVAGALAGLSCGDPVHDAQVASLGPEANGVPPGPTHRPGQPCLTCHGGLGPASQVFVAAGTVYLHQYPDMTPDVGGAVHLVDVNGLPTSPDPTTNSVGNFYVTSDQWNPVFPIGAPGPQEGAKVPEDISVNTADGGDGGSTPMTTQIARGGVYASCGYCHVDPPGPSSPGHVYYD